jgi:hypothetical protein
MKKKIFKKKYSIYFLLKNVSNYKSLYSNKTKIYFRYIHHIFILKIDEKSLVEKSKYIKILKETSQLDFYSKNSFTF